MKRLRLSASVMLLIVVFVVFHSIVHADEADEIIRSWMSQTQVPGAALIVLKNGRIVKEAYYGYADITRHKPVTDSTIFEIASMTKQFTAAAVLLLVEDGKLNLDDPVTKYLPDLPPAWNSITIRRLLDHTSGIYDDWVENDRYFQSKNSDQEFLDALKISKLKFASGERYAYSCGPFIAGMIISRVSGTSFGEFMRKRIFEPLDMSSTFVNGTRDLAGKAAVGYAIRDGKLQNGVQISRAAHARGDVGISTTARDLVLWLAAHNDERLLKRRSLEEIFRFAKLNDGSAIPSGLGWWLNPIRGEPIRHHGGALRTGFNSTINWYPRSGLSVILLANRFRAGANDIGHIVAGEYDKTYRSVSKRKPTTDPEPERTKKFYEMLSELSNGAGKSLLAAKDFPYRYYEASDLKDLLEGSNEMDFRGCDDISKRDNRVFGELVREICFFRLNGPDPRYVSFLLDEKRKVLYIEPFEY